MKPKVLVLVLLITGVLAIGAIATASKIRQQRREPPLHGRLKWYAQQAKAEGQQKITIPTPLVDYLGSDGFNDIDQALTSYTVVVAQLLEKHTYQHTDDNLVTWYKFSIVEALTDTRSPSCPGCLGLSPPSEMLPLNANEFVIAKNGGKLIIDDVEINELDADFPDFQNSEKYLLLISLYPSRVAMTAGGPIGVFSLNESGTLTPVSSKSNIFKAGMDNKFGNSLGLLKQRLHPQKSN